MDTSKTTGYCWVNRAVKGTPPAPRQAHALALVGKTAYIFGGSSGNSVELQNGEDAEPVFYNDLFTLKLIGQHVSWERVKQTGDIPSPRDGHTMCSVGSFLYLFGGTDQAEGHVGLEGLYLLDTAKSKWERCVAQGNQPRTLGHTAAVIDNSVYVFGGICQGVATNSMFLLNTDILAWTPLVTTGSLPAPRCDHACAIVGETFYVMGGTGGENLWFNDMHCFDTATLQWRKITTEGSVPLARCFHTFAAHHQKDIYLFGGCNDSFETKSVFSDLYKFNIGSLKWKKPSTSGSFPEKRFGHSACIIYGQLIIFGGMNNQTDFNDVCILQTRAASKYLYRDAKGQPENNVFSALGFTPTDGPELNFGDLQHVIPAPYKFVHPERPKLCSEYDLSVLKQDVNGKLEEVFAYIKHKFDQLETEKSALNNAVQAFKEEQRLHMEKYEKQQEELQAMIEKHKTETEEWIKSEREKIDEEKRKLAAEQMQLAEQQDNLLKEQEILSENSKRLEAIRRIGSIISEVDMTE